MNFKDGSLTGLFAEKFKRMGTEKAIGFENRALLASWENSFNVEVGKEHRL